jgi:CarD family transcriptional regulator
MYESGQYVLCRSGGVWRVDTVKTDEIHLTEHETGSVKIIPANGDEIVRGISSKEIILEIIERIGFIATIKAPRDKIRLQIYKDAMELYEEIEWVKIIKSVYLRREDHRLSSIEIEYAERAKRYLHGEISVLLAIPTDKVEAYIAAAVSADDW